MPKAKTTARTQTRKPATRSRKTSTASRIRTKSSKPGASKQTATPHIIKHHAKRLWHATPMFVHGMVAGAFIGLVLVFSLGKVNNASALTLDAVRDCDSYAIIHCGSLSTAELKKDYANTPYAHAIYKHFGITATDISNIGSTAVAGRVYDNGQVKVAGKVVATKAITAARKYVKGSHTVTVGGNTYYVRYVSAELSRSSEAAFVVMKNGVFDYAIMGPCGNPIMATAKVATTTPTQPTPTTTTTTAAPTTTTTTPIQTTSNTQQPKITTAVAGKTTTLPNTGPGAVIIVLTLSIFGGYLFHRTHHHVKHRRRFHYLG